MDKIVYNFHISPDRHLQCVPSRCYFLKLRSTLARMERKNNQ